MGSGAHDRQRSGAIPDQLSQTALKIASEFATFYIFYLLPDTFLGKTFRARIWPVLESGICSEMT